MISRRASAMFFFFTGALVGCAPPSYEGDPLTTPSRLGTGETEGEPVDESTEEEDEEPKPAGACSAETTSKACFACCMDEGPANALDVYTNELAACLCTTPGTCATECGATLCAGAKTDSACSACVNDASDCEDRAFAACENDAGCKALLQCADASRCGAKK